MGQCTVFHNIKRSMMDKGYFNESMLGKRELYADAVNYTNNLTALAKDKYEVDEGPLFRFRLSPLSDMFEAIPNVKAFEMLETSSAKMELKSMESVKYKNYEVTDGEVVTPVGLPTIKLKC